MFKHPENSLAGLSVYEFVSGILLTILSLILAVIEGSWIFVIAGVVWFLIALLNASILSALAQIVEYIKLIYDKVDAPVSPSDASSLNIYATSAGSGWVCPKCGKTNPDYCSDCGCGYSKK